MYNFNQVSSVYLLLSISIPVIGNGLALGITDGTSFASFGSGIKSYNYARTSTSGYGSLVGFNMGTSNALVGTKSLGVTKDASKSGLVGILPSLSISSRELGRWLIRF